MSPALNGSSALQRFERSNAIEIRNGIMFDFYPGLPQMYSNYLQMQCSKIEHKYAHAVQCRCYVFCCPFKTVQCLLCAKSVWLQCLLCAKSPGVFGFMCSVTPMLLLCGTFNYNMVGACYLALSVSDTSVLCVVYTCYLHLC